MYQFRQFVKSRPDGNNTVPSPVMVLGKKPVDKLDVFIFLPPNPLLPLTLEALPRISYLLLLDTIHETSR